MEFILKLGPDIVHHGLKELLAGSYQDLSCGVLGNGVVESATLEGHELEYYL